MLITKHPIEHTLREALQVSLLTNGTIRNITIIAVHCFQSETSQTHLMGRTQKPRGYPNKAQFSIRSQTLKENLMGRTLKPSGYPKTSQRFNRALTHHFPSQPIMKKHWILDSTGHSTSRCYTHHVFVPNSNKLPASSHEKHCMGEHRANELPPIHTLTSNSLSHLLSGYR